MLNLFFTFPVEWTTKGKLTALQLQHTDSVMDTRNCLIRFSASLCPLSPTAPGDNSICYTDNRVVFAICNALVLSAHPLLRSYQVPYPSLVRCRPAHAYFIWYESERDGMVRTASSFLLAPPPSNSFLFNVT